MSILGNVLRGVLRSAARGRAGEGGAEAARYIELLKKCVGNAVYDDDRDLMSGIAFEDAATGKRRVPVPAAADPARRRAGTILPSRAHTMVGDRRLDNLQHCVETALREAVPGDLAEVGAWRGGAAILMRGILKAHGVTDRLVWVADSFTGPPRADPARYPRETKLELHRFADLAVPLEQVRENFARYGLLDGQLRFLEGWFRDTLPAAPIQRLAVLHLDCGMYESTLDAMANLYPRLSPRGFAIVGDYFAEPACRAAVDDYLKERGLRAEIGRIDSSGAFWRKQ